MKYDVVLTKDPFHPVAVTVQQENRCILWATFDELGNLWSISEGIDRQDALDTASKLDFDQIRKGREALRDLVAEETARWENDDRVRHPSVKHSRFVTGIDPDHRSWVVENLESIGYTTAYLWEAHCRQAGPDTFDWMLVPPNYKYK